MRIRTHKDIDCRNYWYEADTIYNTLNDESDSNFYQTTLGPIAKNRCNIVFDNESILIKAEQLTNSDRPNDYGHPLDNFTGIAAYWNLILKDYLLPGAKIPPERIGLCMIATKLDRESFKHNIDNLIDIAGYAKTIESVHKERAIRSINTTTFDEGML